MKFGYSLPLCVVSATQLLVLLCSILTLYCPTTAYGLSVAENFQSSDAATLAQRRVSSVPKTASTRRVMPRHRCDPGAERELRKKLENKDKKIRKLRLRLAQKENKTKLSGKNSKVQAHHKSPYCFSYGLIKKILKKFNSNSELTAIREKVEHLKGEVKYLQRWYRKQLSESDDRRELAVSEEKRFRELVLPNWNASEFTFSSDSQSLSGNMNAFRDGLIVIGSVVDRMLQTADGQIDKAAVKRLKNLQRNQSDHQFGIYPLLEDLCGFAASRNATLPRSHLCTGTELKDKVATLEVISKDSLCRARDNLIGRYCHSYGFFTFVRRFLVRMGQTVEHLMSSADSALM